MTEPFDWSSKSGREIASAWCPLCGVFLRDKGWDAQKGNLVMCRSCGGQFIDGADIIYPEDY